MHKNRNDTVGIQRGTYLQQLIERKDHCMIKAVTGIYRRLCIATQSPIQLNRVSQSRLSLQKISGYFYTLKEEGK
jgi:hypothetical protein